jgi:hypothetical protein
MTTRLLPVNNSAPADDDQDQSERESNTTQQARRAKAERVAGHHHQVEQSAEGDEGTGERAKHQGLQDRQMHLAHTRAGDQFSDVLRCDGIEWIGCGRLLFHEVIPPADEWCGRWRRKVRAAPDCRDE